MIRLMVYFFEIIVCYIIQSTLFHYVSLANVMPNLLLILVVSTAYMRGKMSGLFLGFFSGLLVDITFGNLIGLYALLYMVIGYLNGFSNRIYAEDDFTLPIIFVGISNFVYGFFYYVFEFLFRGKLNLMFYLLRIIVPQTIYTIVIAVFLYKLLHTINNFLNRNLNEEA